MRLLRIAAASFFGGHTMNTTIRLAGVARESIVDGPGLRFAVFCQGCPHNCPDCHNPDTHDFNGGQEIPIHRILAAIDENPLLAGVTFSGGEPSCQPQAFLALAEEIRKRGLNIWMYSGYTLEELFRFADPNGSGYAARDKRWENPAMRAALRQLLQSIDVLIDGRFQKDKRDLTLLYRGSSNQRVIDMRKTLSTGRLTLVDLTR
jgi:anaerobic ribonucleoside-triphosphate reductase activating protein